MIAALLLAAVSAAGVVLWASRRAERARAINAAMRRHPAGSGR